MKAEQSELSSGTVPVGDELAGLMAAAQNGDKAAYDMLLRRCIPLITVIARKVGAPTDCIDDVVQETLVTLHGARHTFDPNRPFAAWLNVLARRRCIDVMRRQGRNRGREVHAPVAYENYPDGASTPEQKLDAAARRAVLRDAVDSLPPAQREAVQRLAVNDESLADAAAATQRSKVSLKVSFHRALGALRARLLGDGS